eukprot:COSAG02_NODE_57102_length_282_cov_0.743169_1_plen_64_part_01
MATQTEPLPFDTQIRLLMLGDGGECPSCLGPPRLGKRIAGALTVGACVLAVMADGCAQVPARAR